MSVQAATLQTELEAWCASYMEAFCAFDAGRIAAAWAFPATVSQNGRIYLFKDEAGFAHNTEKLCGFYQRQGLVRAERRVLQVLALGPETASMRVADVMFDAEGRILAEWEAGYTLQKIKGDWRTVFATADGETASWAARGTPLGQ